MDIIYTESSTLSDYPFLTNAIIRPIGNSLYIVMWGRMATVIKFVGRSENVGVVHLRGHIILTKKIYIQINN